jgi:lysophospholipase L1-like esterase
MRIWSRHLAILKYKLRHLSPFLKSECFRILCFGDSNTWGYPPDGGPRFHTNDRWPGVLQYSLGKKAIIFEDGLNGRTTMWDDPQIPGLNGRQALLPILNHYAPLDLIIIILGTNDLKARFNKSAISIAEGVKQLCQDIKSAKSGRSGSISEILVVSPPPILQPSPKMRIEFEGAIEKSKSLAKHYSEIAMLLNIHFLDAKKIISASKADSVHWDSSSHKIFGQFVAEKITNVFANRLMKNRFSRV